MEAVRTYPDRFLGFGAVPLGMELEEAEDLSGLGTHLPPGHDVRDKMLNVTV